MARKRLKRVLTWACILAFVEIFVLNIKWVEFRLLGAASVPFSFTVGDGALCLAVLLGAAFLEELESLLFRVDGRLLGGRAEIRPASVLTGRYDTIFWVAALVFGLVFVFIIPPMSAPDETNHFTRAWMLAHGEALPYVGASKQAAGKISGDLRAFLQTWNARTWLTSRKLTPNDYRALLGAAATSPSPTIEADFPYPYLSFFMYLPQAVGILIGQLFFRLFGLSGYYNPYVQLIFARIANLCCYLLCIAAALRMTPVFRRTLAILTLMPMSVFIASSCSYDVFMYTTSILYAAYILRCAYDPALRRLGARQKTVLIGLGFLILVGKYVYFPLLLLLYLIPREKFGGASRVRVFVTMVLPSVGLLVVWLLIYRHSIAGMAKDVYSQAYLQQAMFVLRHPMKYIAILTSNLNLYGKSWATGFVGLFGWLNVPMPMAFVTFYLVLLGLSAVLETAANRSLLSKPLMGFVCVACYVLIATAEYVVWTPGLGNGRVGQYTIIGVQGRYFIPFAYPLLLLLSNRLPCDTYLLGKLDNGLHRVIPFVLSGTLLYALLFLLKTYWTVA